MTFSHALALLCSNVLPLQYLGVESQPSHSLFGSPAVNDCRLQVARNLCALAGNVRERPIVNTGL